ncbi:MAG TPA: FHA domain-containing protein [Pyrinomonadaceae bacterium]|nr:FHA domain-containing protein [Pyrinomonadaceae bacterium]HMP65270.1 FHA domain-containing protein [Pyrinomonadaceae bacterium]
MKIILAQDRPGQRPAELSFDKPRVLIGRAANECDISFDQGQYPMVSRRHAELRWSGSSWMIADLGSSFGTYVNGQKISEPVAITVGNSLQFGAEGPVVRVIWFEEGGSGDWSMDAAPPPISEPSVAPAAPTSEGLSAYPATQARPQEKTAVPSSSPERSSLEFPHDPSRQPLVLGSVPITLGRDPQCTVVFEASSATVSRRHAEIRPVEGGYLIADNKSFNGTVVNGRRIAEPALLSNGDEIQMGLGGPVLKFVSSAGGAVKTSGQLAAGQPASPDFSRTMVAKLDTPAVGTARIDSAEPQLVRKLNLSEGQTINIGRDPHCEVCLDGLQISNRHARLSARGGEVFIEDLGSTNGTFVSGQRVSRQALSPTDTAQVGSFLIKVDQSGDVSILDSRAKTRIDVVALTQDISAGFGKGKLRLLDSVSLSIKPNEFIGLIGPSGAGKSTFIEAMAGARPASAGNVLINNQDLYRNFDSLRQAIGYVPQDDIIHRELSVFRTLKYVARLRLSRDVSSAEVKRIIEEVLDVSGLSERRDVPVHRLSGGQRKRVSVAVELITKPQIIYLDEPTTGLDPATEFNMMQLFRQMSESGRTVVMTTHSMDNIMLFDKVVLLMRGKLIFYGAPAQALKHFGAADFRELYRKLEAAQNDVSLPGSDKTSAQQSSDASETFRQKFTATPAYKEYVHDPLKELGKLDKPGARKKVRLGIFGSIRQFMTLSVRYLDILLKDKLTLLILFLQAPVIALLTLIVVGREHPRDFLYFVIALVAVWFGTSVSAREIIREKRVFVRERMFNLGIFPYLASKLFVLFGIVTLQCLLLFVPLKFFDVVGIMSMPGEYAGIPQLWAMILTASVGIALGLLISALVRTSEMATSIVPLVLIPQILFSGIAGVPTGVGRAVSMTMPSAWSFDTMKRFSTLDTLEPEGANPSGFSKGQGLYKFIETENDRALERARRDIEDYKRIGGQLGDDGSGQDPWAEKLVVPEVRKVPDDLSTFVTFLHPWMHEVLNQLVLMLMFGLLTIITLVTLRIRDTD